MNERFAGRFLLLRSLGKGGMGEVFLARDTTSGFECALKRLHQRGATEVPHTVRNEFEALTRVRHPAVVGVHEMGVSPEGVPFYTMEYVPGLPADQAIAPGDWPSLYFVAARVAHGLEALHAARVCHGDLKPTNLLVVPPERAGTPPRSVRLVDFGLATWAEHFGAGHTGTAGFAAPEIVQGDPPDASSDLYGFGATLYAIVARRPPFEGEDGATVLRRQRAGPPSTAPLEAAGAPAALIELILRLMAVSRAERPAGAGAVRRELEALHPAARQPLHERIDAVSVVGRERELARLETWWARVPPRPPMTILQGAPGTGKSAVLGELATRAALAGRSVIHLSCGAFEGSGAVAAALLQRIAAAASIEPDAALLAGLAGEGVRETDLDALAAAAVEWSGAMTPSGGGLLILLDDVERLDDRSRAWVRRVVSSSEPAPIGWLLARRPEGRVSDDEAILEDTGLAERITLPPLEPAAVAQLAAVRLHHEPPAALVGWLWARGGGHPGLSVELLRRAAAAGALVEEDLLLRVNETALGSVGAPEDYEATLIERFESLPPAARELANALAVHGAALAADQAARLAPEAAAGIEALVASGLALRTQEGELLLWPPVLGDRLAAALPEDRRQALHRAALALPGLGPTQRFRHLRGAGEAAAALDEASRAIDQGLGQEIATAAAALAEKEVPGRAAEWLERAGQELLRRSLFAAAIPYLERALERTNDHEARGRVWTALARAALQAAQFEVLARCVEAMRREDLTPAVQAHVFADGATGLMMQGERAAAWNEGRDAVTRSRDANAPEAEGVACQTLGYLAVYENRLDEGEALARQAVDAFVRAGRPPFSRAVGLLSHVARARSRSDEAERILREAIVAAREARARLLLQEHLMQLANVQVETGRWEESTRVLSEMARLAVEDARPMGVATAMTNLAVLEGLMGRPRAALKRAREALRLNRRYGMRGEVGSRRALAQARRVAGRVVLAERAARRAFHSIERAGGGEAVLAPLELARALGARGKWKEAREVADTALGAHASVATLQSALLATFAGRAALQLGELHAAEKRLDDVDTWLAGARAPYVAGLAAWLKAGIAFKRGRYAEGFEAGQQALDGLAALPAPPDRAEAALELAFLCPESPDRSARVLQWLDLAATTYKRLGNRRDRERALGLQVEWLKRAEGGTAPAGSELSLIERVSWLLHSITDLKELAQRAMRMAVDQLEAERGLLLLHDRESGQMRVMAEHGSVDATTRDEAMRFSRRVVQRVTDSGGSILIADAWSEPGARSESVENLKLRSIVCVPLFLSGNVIGAVYLDDSRRTHQFGEDERGLLEGFAHLISVAVEKARGHEEIERTKDRLEKENLTLREEVGGRFQYQNLIGSSPEMRRVMALIEPASRARSAVFISGENGTGKELVARILHHTGDRRRGPFVSVNCGAIPETLVESELFGIVAYTATNVRGRDGRFVQANGGTLFLDEIGEMPLNQQVALLAAISNREVTPVGGSKPIPIDVRIVAATNRNLRDLVEEGRFREDLYFRLAVIEIALPPLRERKSDIPDLARHFLRHFAEIQGREVPKLSPDFIAVLMQSDWSGNVRELQNYIDRIVAMNPGPVLRPEPLPRDLQVRAGTLRHSRGRGLIAAVNEVERKMVTEALQKSDGNQSRAARILGLTEQSLRYRLRKYGLATRENRRTRQ